MMIMLHAPDKDTMHNALLKYGVLEYRTAEDGSTYLHPAKGFEVTGFGGAVLPPIWAVKPVYGPDGDLITQGVEIGGFSANVLDTLGALHGVDWSAEGVTWIDPAGATTPAQGW